MIKGLFQSQSIDLTMLDRCKKIQIERASSKLHLSLALWTVSLFFSNSPLCIFLNRSEPSKRLVSRSYLFYLVLCDVQGPVVYRADKAIQRINRYPADK